MSSLDEFCTKINCQYSRHIDLSNSTNLTFRLEYDKEMGLEPDSIPKSIS